MRTGFAKSGNSVRFSQKLYLRDQHQRRSRTRDVTRESVTRGARNKNLSNGLSSLLVDAPIVTSFRFGEAMNKIGTAILASTIFIGPIAGAVLPFLAIGYGVYWLVRRRRKANDPAAPMRAEATKPTMRAKKVRTSMVPT
jgi:hypothetical protein